MSHNVSGPIRIATRASRLAMWQAEHVAALLKQAAPGCDVALVPLSTAGDRDTTEPIHKIGATGVFTREVQRAVLEGHADIAVHSLKDLPTEMAPGLVLAAVPTRGPVFDVLVTPSSRDEVSAVDQLPQGARVGTGSQRRRAQLLYRRPDLKISDVRGNVETRLRKLDEGEFDALVLAFAGLERLGLHKRSMLRLMPPIMYPAAGQGALGIECRSEDESTRSLLDRMNDSDTVQLVTAERTLLSVLRAGCHAAVGTATRVVDGLFQLEAVVLDPQGTQRIVTSAVGTLDDSVGVAQRVAAELQRHGADELIEAAAQQMHTPRPA